MATTSKLDPLIKKIAGIIDEGSDVLVQRRAVFELAIIGVLAKEHLLLIGPPGTGKSAAVQNVAQSFSGKYFEYLIGRFSEPSELFGSLDLTALREGQLKTVTTGMLPEANIAFLDEIFLGSTAILNTLLGILNERKFKRGNQMITVPLWSCVAASNSIPEDPMLAAFADRFLLTAFVEPIEAENIPQLLKTGWQYGKVPQKAKSKLSAKDIETLSAAVFDIDLSKIIAPYTHIVRKMAVRGLQMSDRRIVRGQKLIAAAALLAGRKSATEADLWPIIYMVNDKALQLQVRELLASELQKGENEILRESVRDATYGPAAYAADLTKTGQELLERKPKLQSDDLFEEWSIRVEGLLARIDAGFSEETRPENLSLIRTGLIAAIEISSGSK